MPPRTIAAVSEIRFITKDEVPEVRRAVARGFGGDTLEEEGADERFLELFPLETTIGAFDHGRVVATFGSFDFDLTIPGGVLPLAGTTIVTVQPTHRRQGLLTRMMRMHLEQAIERGQPLAGLWASETPIYGRFGYGPACYGHDLTVPADRVTLPPGPDGLSIRTIDAQAAMDVLPEVYAQVQPATPGFLSRSPAWWEHRRLRDPEQRRQGASAQRIVTASDGDRPCGYLIYRQKERWKRGLPMGKVEIVELVALDDDARRALWHFITNIDLYPTVHWWNAPVDDPIEAEASDPRRITARRLDTLWLRVLDVPRALEERRYEQDGRLVLEVIDEFMSRGGTWELDVKDGTASCRPSDAPPDIRVGLADLGALYLGGGSAIQRRRAQRLDGRDDAVRHLDALLRTARAPFCGEVF